MKQSIEKKFKQNYNTSINILGGIRDVIPIIEVLGKYNNQKSNLEELIFQQNELSLRTERSRTRIELEIRKALLEFRNQDHQELIQGVFSERVPLQDKELSLFWQYALNNRLFREITSRVFVKTYYSGRLSICRDDIRAYLKEFLQQNGSLQISWSEKTITMLSTKYLSLMSKLDFLSPGRVKSFKHIRPSSEAQVLFLYFAKLYSPSSSNILTNEFLPVSFIPLEDIQDRLRKLSLKGYFNLNFNGVALNIELTHSYKGICDVLYN